MTDLLSVLPDLPVGAFSNVLPSLEKNHITTADLLSLDAVDVAKRAVLPLREVRRLVEAVLAAIHAQYSAASPSGASEADVANASSHLLKSGRELVDQWQTISSLDDTLDEALGGGIPTSQLTEITGESGVGKTQLLLTLLLSVQLPQPRGLGKSALYISTEAPLQTTRLQQLLQSHPVLLDASATHPATLQPSLSRILSIQTSDLESQEHILNFQLPVAVQRHNVGLVVVDSITANYRAEFEQGQTGLGNGNSTTRHGAVMAKRSAQLSRMGTLLRNLARTEDIAIVVANQVADRFAPVRQPSRPSTPLASQTGLPTASQSQLYDPMTLDHQQNWFTGWGDERPRVDILQDMGLKTPSLGLVWSNQIASRIALLKGRTKTREHDGIAQRRRYMKMVFAPWAPNTDGAKGVEYEIGAWGIRAVTKDVQNGEKARDGGD